MICAAILKELRRGKNMYLKKIELEGFKSFADKTVLEFMSGITTVIGLYYMRLFTRFRKTFYSSICFAKNI